MLKKFKKTVVLMFILLFTAFPISTQGSVSEVESVKNSIVRIYTEDSTGEGWIGSGFYIGKKDGYQYYVTNDHVVSIVNERTGRILDSASAIVFSDLYTSTDIIEVEIVYQTLQTGIDLAILRIPDTGEEKRTPVTLKSCENVAITDNVYVLGFPAAVDHLSQDRMIALNSTPDDVIVTKGNVSNAKFKFNSTDVIVIDAGVNGGNSGGPVVDDKGNVVGIATWSSTETETINMAIQSDELIDILESKGFPYNNTSSSQAPKATEKKNNSSESKSTDSVFNGINEKTKMNLYMLLGFLIFFVLILVLVIIIVMMKKSSKKKNRRNDDWKNGNNHKRL